MPITIQQGVLNYKNSQGEFQNIDVLKGDTGPVGNPGEQGIPGVSPSISIADITGGHRITIVDAIGSHSFDVMDGTDGDDGRSILSVQKTGTEGLVDTYTITYTDNTTTTFTVTNGVNGANGTDGTTFTPSVSEQGVISWTNDGEKTNPQPINIKGPQGPQGDPGDDYILTAADKTEIAQQAAQEVNVPVQDVQINGTSILSNGVANVPLCTSSTPGVIAGYNATLYAIDGKLYVNSTGDNMGPVKAGTINSAFAPLSMQHAATFYGLAKAAGSDEKNSTLSIGTYTEAAKSAISQMLNAPVTVSGTTPTIAAKPGIQYVCGEVSTLTITFPASGCIDIVFESGSTPTVLTVTPPTGKTMKWPDWFDPTVLEANKTYEINIQDGFGVVTSWA